MPDATRVEPLFIDALIFSKFHLKSGPTIICSDPPRVLDGQFNIVSKFFFPNKDMNGSIVTLRLNDWMIGGVPLLLEDKKKYSHARNAFQWCVIIICDHTTNSDLFRYTVSNLATQFFHLEVQSTFLSNEVNETQILAILQQVRCQINQHQACNVSVHPPYPLLLNSNIPVSPNTQENLFQRINSVATPLGAPFFVDETPSALPLRSPSMSPPFYPINSLDASNPATASSTLGRVLVCLPTLTDRFWFADPSEVVTPLIHLPTALSQIPGRASALNAIEMKANNIPDVPLALHLLASFIDGNRTIRTLSDCAGLPEVLVQQCVRALLFEKLVVLTEVVRPSSRYAICSDGIQLNAILKDPMIALNARSVILQNHHSPPIQTQIQQQLQQIQLRRQHQLLLLQQQQQRQQDPSESPIITKAHKNLHTLHNSQLDLKHNSLFHNVSAANGNVSRNIVGKNSNREVYEADDTFQANNESVSHLKLTIANCEDEAFVSTPPLQNPSKSRKSFMSTPSQIVNGNQNISNIDEDNSSQLESPFESLPQAAFPFINTNKEEFTKHNQIFDRDHHAEGDTSNSASDTASNFGRLPPSCRGSLPLPSPSGESMTTTSNFDVPIVTPIKNATFRMNSSKYEDGGISATPFVHPAAQSVSATSSANHFTSKNQQQQQQHQQVHNQSTNNNRSKVWDALTHSLMYAVPPMPDEFSIPPTMPPPSLTSRIPHFEALICFLLTCLTNLPSSSLTAAASLMSNPNARGSVPSFSFLGPSEQNNVHHLHNNTSSLSHLLGAGISILEFSIAFQPILEQNNISVPHLIVFATSNNMIRKLHSYPCCPQSLLQLLNSIPPPIPDINFIPPNSTIVVPTHFVTKPATLNQILKLALWCLIPPANSSLYALEAHQYFVSQYGNPWSLAADSLSGEDFNTNNNNNIIHQVSAANNLTNINYYNTNSSASKKLCWSSSIDATKFALIRRFLKTLSMRSNFKNYETALRDFCSDHLIVVRQSLLWVSRKSIPIAPTTLGQFVSVLLYRASLLTSCDGTFTIDQLAVNFEVLGDGGNEETVLKRTLETSALLAGGLQLSYHMR